MKQKKVHIMTFGCQMNVSDSEKILLMLHTVGYESVSTVADADMVIVNTCSVRAKAEDRVYGILLTMKGELKKNPDLLIGVGGCVAQQEGEKLLKKIPHLSFVFGTHNLHLLPQIVTQAESGKRLSETAFIDDSSRFDLFPDHGGISGITRTVTIMQGCDNYCSYCIVPYVRGREVSRKRSDILNEVAKAADAGVREVTLLGQNVNSYGRKGGYGTDFSRLIRDVAKVSGIKRIRFMTSHPKDMSDPLLDCFADVEKLCSHIHLPVQSGSDRILALMNRGYTRSEYMNRIERLKLIRPDILVTSDIIVGFPGETEDDFSQSLSLMKEVGYSDTYSFVYSPRPETKAASLPDETSKSEKSERLKRLMALQSSLTKGVQSRFVGSGVEVLVEGISKKEGQVFGRSSGNRTVNFAGSIDMIGSMQLPEIIKNLQNSLLGELKVK
ncbi:MAG: tRNA (N6-isopentenyl adenosine(37)-C2)-methylthiotransferase MiaB [Geobacteraceae bacterium]|nr:tRNA (N6-isopentenyl adenosine(37)-C2)-methylthiotransferase MiaB [Geobacteraceae bacterium]